MSAIYRLWWVTHPCGEVWFLRSDVCRFLGAVVRRLDGLYDTIGAEDIDEPIPTREEAQGLVELSGRAHAAHDAARGCRQQKQSKGPPAHRRRTKKT
jgi:hypothetical protein